MAKAGWVQHRRDPALVGRDLQRIRARWPQEKSTDPSRGQTRFVIEALMAERRGERLPARVMDRAIELAIAISKD
jgi:hypothetical protein